MFTELYTTSQTDIYADGVTNLTITSSNTFNVQLLIDGMVSMRGDKRKAMNLVVHPEQYGALLALDQFTDASKLGDTRVNINGFIGLFLGVDVYETTNV